MNVNRKAEFVAGFVTALLGCVWAWLFQAFMVTSRSDLIQAIGMVWIILHLPLQLVFFVLNPPKYLDPVVMFVGVFVQWFFIGWLGFRFRQWLTNRSKDSSMS